MLFFSLLNMKLSVLQPSLMSNILLGRYCQKMRSKVGGIWGKDKMVLCHILDVASCASHPVRLQDSLMSNISRRNQLVSQIFFFFFFFFFRRDIYQRKVASKTTTFSWLRLRVSGIQCFEKNPSILKIPKSFVFKSTEE